MLAVPLWLLYELGVILPQWLVTTNPRKRRSATVALF